MNNPFFTKVFLEKGATGEQIPQSRILDDDRDTGIEVERTADSDTIVMKTAGVDRATITSTGLGIGTSTPATALHARADTAVVATIERMSSFNASIEYKNSSGSMFAGVTSGATGFAIDGDNNISASPFLFVQKSNGKVGIGTSSPVESLHVSGGLKLGLATQATAGTIQWNAGAGKFQGYTGSAWVDLH